MATTFQEELEVLEKSIRQLQIDWEKFFGGVERKPPVDLKTRVENQVRKFSNTEMRNATERFRALTLIARYNTFAELWAKKLRALEEGRPVGIHGAKALAAAEAYMPHPTHVPVPARSASTGEFRVASAERDAEAVRGLFEKFLEARIAAGESGAVKFDSFKKLIAQQSTRILAEKGAQAVDFRLETKDGKVSLKARPVK